MKGLENDAPIRVHVLHYALRDRVRFSLPRGAERRGDSETGVRSLLLRAWPGRDKSEEEPEFDRFIYLFTSPEYGSTVYATCTVPRAAHTHAHMRQLTASLNSRTVASTGPAGHSNLIAGAALLMRAARSRVSALPLVARQLLHCGMPFTMRL